MRRGFGVSLTLIVVMSCGAGASDADDKPADPATDADLLEFLGSVDSGVDPQAADDGSWIDYLSQTDINKVANARDQRQPPSQGQRTPPPSPGAPKNE